MVRILVLTSSQFGAGYGLTQMLSSELDSREVEYRIRRVPEVVFPQAVRPPVTDVETATTDDLEWADGYLVISQAHTGMISASLKAFIDQNHTAADNNAFANRTFGAFVTSTRPAGGQERVIEDLLNIAGTWGCLPVTPGGTANRLGELNGSALGVPLLLREGKIAKPEETAEVLYLYLDRFEQITKATKDLIKRSAK